MRERTQYYQEGNTNRMRALAVTSLLTGAAFLAVGIYGSIEDADHIDEERTRISRDISLSETEKSEKIAQIPSENDQNQAIGAAGLFALAVGAAVYVTTAVEASQKRE